MKNEKVLVIGGGAVGSCIVKSLIHFGVKNVFLSTKTENIKGYQNLFGSPTLTNFSGLGGLGNFWHGIIDLGSLNAEKITSSELKEVFQLTRGFVPDIAEVHQEIVPLLPVRPHKLLKQVKGKYSLLPESKKIKFEGSTVQVLFSDDTQQTFDRVFICSGAINASNVLVNSGLAENSDTVSDHFVFYEREFKEIDEKAASYLKVKRKSGHVARRYEKIDNCKVTYRPVFGSGSYITPKDKAIYNNTAFDIMKSLLKNFTNLQILESVYLRYGILFPAKKYRRFFQTPVENCYKWQGDELKVDQDKVKEVADLFRAKGMVISEEDFVSGIHYFNTLKNLDPKIGLRNADKDENVVLISSAVDFNPGPHHFTFKMIAEGYALIKKMYSV